MFYQNLLRCIPRNTAIFFVFTSMWQSSPLAQTQIESQTHLIVNQSALSISYPSSLGCLNAHLQEDAKTPILMIPIDEDIFIPVGGILGASWLPAEPANPNDSIAGIDSDGDCVRDDIERYITNIYHRKSDYLVRENLFRYAIWMNRFLNLPPLLTQMHAKTAVTNMRIAGQCVKIFLGDEAGGIALTNLFAEFHNSWPRSDLYVANIVNYISGWTTRDDPVIVCN